MQQYQTISPFMVPFVPPYLPPVLTPQIDAHTDIVNVNGTIGGNPSPVSVTNVTTPTYTALATDYLLAVDTSVHATTITLPTGKLGTVYIIKDLIGNAATNPITIIGTGGELIDGSSATINVPYGSISLVFTGTSWSIV